MNQDTLFEIVRLPLSDLNDFHLFLGAVIHLRKTRGDEEAVRYVEGVIKRGHWVKTLEPKGDK